MGEMAYVMFRVFVIITLLCACVLIIVATFRLITRLVTDRIDEREFLKWQRAKIEEEKKT